MKFFQRLALAAVAAACVVPSPVSAQTLFSDAFDTTNSALWNLRTSSADTAVTFGFDYSTLGIPSAPNSGGSTRGLRMAVNIAAPAAQEAVSLSPVGGSFTGLYRVQFDMWINYNGPLNGGGTGSTELLTAGVGTSGNQLQWGGTGTTADGVWFAVTGDGGAAQDYRAYVATSQQGTASGVYAAVPDAVFTENRDNFHPYYTNAFPGGLTAPAAQISSYAQQTNSTDPGTVGFAWRDVTIDKEGDVITWSIDGVRIATVTNALTSNNVFIGCWDPFTSVSGGPDVQFGLIDNFRVIVIPEPSVWALGLLGAAGLWFCRRRR